MSLKSSGASAPLLGNPEPRLFTEPLRELTPETSKGFELIEFARIIGTPLLPWQERVAIRALELHPDGSYRFRTVVVIVARQNGKTHLSKVLALWKMYLDGAQMVLGVAQDLSIAKEVWEGAVDLATASDVLRAEIDGPPRRANGQETFKITNGARYKISAATRSAGRGLSVDHLTFDEIREQRNFDAWSALSKTTNARPNAQIWCISNMGDERSVVLNHLRESALSGANDSIGIFEYSAPPDADITDRSAWAMANPALGHTVTEQALASSLATDPPAVFLTECLCVKVDSLNGAFDLGAWNASRDPVGTMEALRDKAVFCVDVAPDGEHVTVAAAAKQDNFVRIEIVAAWKSTEEAREKLPELLDSASPMAIAWFPGGPASAIGPLMRERDAIELKGIQVYEACMSFVDQVRSRRIIHPGDPLLDAHVAGATKLPSGDGFRFSRTGGGHVDAAYAAAGAVQVALTFEQEPPLPEPMVI